jgi:predicted Zn-dependent peptidase
VGAGGVIIRDDDLYLLAAVAKRHTHLADALTAEAMAALHGRVFSLLQNLVTTKGFFFKKDSSSTALSFKKKRQFYIASRSEHHHNTYNAHNKTLHHHNLGEETKANHRELRRRRQRCATPKIVTRCKP